MKKLIYILFAVALMIVSAPTVHAQKRLVNPLGSVAVPIYADTVTNGGTAYLTVQNIGSAEYTGFQVNCTEISGTTAGTITLLGSLDGTNFKAIPTVDTQTSITTATALDVASQTFVWRIAGNPFRYYRVSWTGTGTMSASFTAYLWSN